MTTRSLLAVGLFFLATPAVSGTYVGFSTATVDGTVGFKGLQQACAADFGSTARICTTSEIMATAPFPTPQGNGFGWVLVSWPLVPDTQSNGVYFDRTGIRMGDFNCRGFSTGATASSLVVDQDGRFSVLGCFGPNHVACCTGPAPP